MSRVRAIQLIEILNQGLTPFTALLRSANRVPSLKPACGLEAVRSYSDFKPSSFLSRGPSLNASIHFLRLLRALPLAKADKISYCSELGIQDGPLKTKQETCKHHGTFLWVRPKSSKTYRNVVKSSVLCPLCTFSRSRMTYFLLLSFYTKATTWVSSLGSRGESEGFRQKKDLESKGVLSSLFSGREGPLSTEEQGRKWPHPTGLTLSPVATVF